MTQTKSTPEADATADRIRELNEQVLESGRNAGVSFLDAYEKTLKTFADYQDKIGDSSQVEWVATVAHAQAKFTREVSEAYTTSARELLAK
jgi:hypothetical protein